MTDILDWLRLIEVEQLLQEEVDEAANEIERLRAENARLSEALQNSDIGQSTEAARRRIGVSASA
jgi:predicted nuclease with TOPRIM domain